MKDRTRKTHSLEENLLKKIEIPMMTMSNQNIKKNESFTNTMHSQMVNASSTQSNMAFLSEADSNYDVMDLTYTLISMDLFYHIPILIIFFILLVIRYYLVIYLLILWFESPEANWEWIAILGFSRILFFILVMKVSLKNS